MSIKKNKKAKKGIKLDENSRAGLFSWSSSQERVGGTEVWPLPAGISLNVPEFVTCSLQGYKLFRWFTSLVNVFSLQKELLQVEDIAYTHTTRPNTAEPPEESVLLICSLSYDFCCNQVKFTKLYLQKYCFLLNCDLYKCFHSTLNRLFIMCCKDVYLFIY